MFSDIPGYFKAWGDNEDAIIGGIESLARSGETWIYREAFRYLVGYDIPEMNAERCWREALASWSNPNQRRSGRQQLRAALLDYLHHVGGERFGSTRDGLTGLYNHAFFKQYLERFLPHLRQQKDPRASVLSFWVDGLAGYARRQGTAEADRAMRQVADLLRSRTAETDVVCRHQGSFGAFLPSTDLDQAIGFAESIRSAAEHLPCRGPREIIASELTLSVGVASLPNHGIGAMELMRCAREGMELARKSRQGVCAAPTRLNRRRHKRHNVSSVLDYSPRAAKAYNAAVAYDISDRGAAFGCELELMPGADLLLRFRRPFWPQDVITPATVVRCNRQSCSNVFRLCVQFEKPLQDFCSHLEKTTAA